MKDYNEIANRVLQRRDEYLEEKKRKKIIFYRRVTIAFSCCIMLLLGVGIWQMDFLKKIEPSPDPDVYVTTTHTEKPVSTESSEYTVTTAVTTSFTDISTDHALTTTSANNNKQTTAEASSSRKNTVTTTTRHSSEQNGSNAANVRTTASGIGTAVSSRSSSGNLKTSTGTSARPVATSTTSTRRNTTSTTRRYTTTTRPRTSTTRRYTTTTTRSNLTTTRLYTTTTRYIPPSTTIVYTTTRRWYTSATMMTSTYYTTTVPPIYTSTTPPLSSSIHTMPCYEFTYNDTTYTVALPERTAIIDETDIEIDSGTTYSYKTDEPINYTLYKYKNFDPRFICKVKFDTDDKVYLGINYDFIPQNIGEYLSATDLRNSILTRSAYDYRTNRYIQPFNKAKLLELLTPLADTPIIQLPDCGQYLLDIECFIEGVIVDDYNIDFLIFLTDDGLIEFFIDNVNFYADVGVENINKIYQQLIE